MQLSSHTPLPNRLQVNSWLANTLHTVHCRIRWEWDGRLLYWSNNIQPEESNQTPDPYSPGCWENQEGGPLLRGREGGTSEGGWSCPLPPSCLALHSQDRGGIMKKVCRAKGQKGPRGEATTRGIDDSCMHAQPLGHVWLSETPWTVAH